MTRSLTSLLVLAACTTAPGPAPAPATPAPTPTPAATAAGPAWQEATLHEVEPGHAGLVEALGSAGACKASDVEKPLRVWSWKTGGTTVYAAECEAYAYQSDFEWWGEGADGYMPLQDGQGRAVKFLGFPQLAPATGQASWLTKSRGPGDCGDWYLYQLEGGKLIEKEHRSRACDDEMTELPPPSEWELVPARPAWAFVDQAALQATLGGTATPIVNELSGETSGVDIARASAGPVGGVPCAAEVSLQDHTWGCELTADFELNGFATPKGAYLAIHYGTGHRAGVVFASLAPPVEKMVVKGVPCAEFAHFHADGSLAGCPLAAPHTFGAVTLPARSDVSLREDGTVEHAFVYEAVTIGGKAVEAGYVELSPAGDITSVSPDFFGD